MSSSLDTPSAAPIPTKANIGVRTLRTDRWWLMPAVTVTVLLSFIVYSTWRAFENAYYFSEPLISPFYSPCLATSCVEGSSQWMPIGSWWVLSPALLILVFPLGFRLTCYYYRKAYFRSFWLSPPACAVSEPHTKYTGESRFPLILNNSHRYFFYAGLVFNVLLTYDAIIAFRNADGAWGHMSVGTIALLAVVPFIPPCSWRTVEAFLETPSALQGLDLRFKAQPSPPSLCLDFSHWCGTRRPLRP